MSAGDTTELTVVDTAASDPADPADTGTTATPAMAACRQCGHPLAGGGRFVAWCPGCNWNLDPAAKAQRRGLPGWWLRQQNRLAVKLQQRVINGQADGPGGQGLRVLVLAGATVVHLLTLAVVAGGVLVLLSNWFLPLRIVLGLLLLALAWHVSGLVVRRRRAQPMLTRQQLPGLFSLLDAVADAAGTARAAGVVISPRFNMAACRRGRVRMIELGAALWATLDDTERVAVLAHEFGHWVAGDMRDMRYVRGAIRSMRRWAELFEPPSNGARNHGRRPRSRSAGGFGSVIVDMIAPLIMLPFAFLAQGLGALLSLAAMRQGQRAEYYADAVSARVAGTAAAVAALDVLLLDTSAAAHLVRMRNSAHDRSPVDALAAYPGEFTADEWERLRRSSALRLSRIDQTHPPTMLRTATLRARPDQPGQLTVDAPSAYALQRELRPHLDAALGGTRSRSRSS